jgi:transketolase
MRGTFIKTLADLAERDARIVLVVGDLGFMAVEPFSQRFPQRFFNAGVAEQNMIGLATGLAREGFLPFAYSIVPFAALRPYEFIRNGAVAHNLQVRIVGVGAGVDYGTNGLTHYGIDDVGALRTQPNLHIYSPADAAQTNAILRQTFDVTAPIYYRLGKDDRLVVGGLDGAFVRDQIQPVNGSVTNGDVLLLTMGSVATEAVAAKQQLQARGVAAACAVVAQISPAPADALARMMRGFKRVVTVEAHYAVGGLASLVSEVIAANGIACQLRRCAIEHLTDGTTGSTAFLYQRYGLDADSIVRAAMR